MPGQIKENSYSKIYLNLLFFSFLFLLKLIIHYIGFHTNTHRCKTIDHIHITMYLVFIISGCWAWIFIFSTYNHTLFFIYLTRHWSVTRERQTDFKPLLLKIAQQRKQIHLLSPIKTSWSGLRVIKFCSTHLYSNSKIANQNTVLHKYFVLIGYFFKNEYEYKNPTRKYYDRKP